MSSKLQRRATQCAWLAAFLTLAAGAAGAGGAFSWLVPAAAPAGWKHLQLPTGGAVMVYPPSLKPSRSDLYSISAAEKDKNGNYLAYLNATPQQGAEKLSSWPAFRVERLREESALTVHTVATAYDLSFRGGKGSCVIDDYVTKLKHNHYREIACFVVGAHKGSVIVAAPPTSGWARVSGELQRAVAAYEVT